MSGASGKVPAAIHLTPEAAGGGPIAKVRDGDVIRLDATPVSSTSWSATSNSTHGISRARRRTTRAGTGTGRDSSPRSCSPRGATEHGASVIPQLLEKHHLMAPLTSADLLSLAPAIPVVVLTSPQTRRHSRKHCSTAACRSSR